MNDSNHQSAVRVPYSVDDLRDVVSPIALRHGVTRLWLFGSRARGEAGPDSDRAFRVDLEPGWDYFQFAGLNRDLEDALDLEVDLVSQVPWVKNLQKR